MSMKILATFDIDYDDESYTTVFHNNYNDHDHDCQTHMTMKPPLI